MSDFLKKEFVFVNQHAESRQAVLRYVSEQAAAAGVATDAQVVYDAFIAREELGETGMTDGFAVPHAKSPAITSAAVFVFKNETPLEWPSFDDNPVDIAIALLVPEGDASTTHIKLLSKTAVLLMDDAFKKTVRDSNDPQVICDAIIKGIEVA